jgi:hypothetical protein
MRGGKRNGAGRRTGVPNKISGTVKENVIAVFEDIGGVGAMSKWAKGNPSDFFRIYSRLLPTQIEGKVEGGLILQIISKVPDPDDGHAEG